MEGWRSSSLAMQMRKHFRYPFRSPSTMVEVKSNIKRGVYTIGGAVLVVVEELESGEYPVSTKGVKDKGLDRLLEEVENGAKAPARIKGKGHEEPKRNARGLRIEEPAGE